MDETIGKAIIETKAWQSAQEALSKKGQPTRAPLVDPNSIADPVRFIKCNMG